jgi:hypothetical protein
MTRSVRPAVLLVLVVPAVLAVLAVLPGSAQQSDTSGRFAFADTTLLRDTLDLSFEELFPLADSLRVIPDTLRALSIRYRFPLRRLVHVADSLAVPVDSVGAVLERERFNPLAARTQDVNEYRWTSTYFIQQTSTTWTNASDWNRVRGPLFVINRTYIDLMRTTTGGTTNLRQSRKAETEAGWRFSPGVSLGGRLVVDRFDTRDPGSLNDENDATDDVQVSLRTRQKPRPGLTSELNLFTGFLDQSKTRLIKRGWSGEMNGRVRWQRGRWLTSDVSGQVTGNLARTRLPSALTDVDTRDRSANVGGTLGLWTSSPVGVNLNYRIRDVLVETPLDSGRIQQVQTGNNSADLSIRGRLDESRQLSVSGGYRTSKGAQSTSLSSINTRRDLEMSVEGRYPLFGASLEGQFRNALGLSRFPRRGADGGYGESLHVRSVRGTATRRLGDKFSLRLDGQVELSSYRYYRIGQYPTPPVNRDQYRQSYKADVSYAPRDGLTSTVLLEVSRNLGINIPAASTASNTENHSYRAGWVWSYRLLRGLTATQSNSITADYQFFPFLREKNRLSLLYNSATALNAVLSPRVTLNLTHTAGYQPSGNYTFQPDGLEAFSRADENRNYRLGLQATYTPTPGISFTVAPDYYATGRKNTVDGRLQPQRSDTSFNFAGGANVNVPVGSRGRLTGTLNRTYRTSSAVTWVRSTPQEQPGVPQDYWNGNLVFSWEL